jgi:hypothetical protein
LRPTLAKVAAARVLWKKLTHCIILDEQMRVTNTNENQPLKDLLQRYRQGSCNSIDIELLQSRILPPHLPTNSSLPKDLLETTIIVTRNETRQIINTQLASKNALAAGKLLLTCLALDTTNNKPIPPQIAAQLTYLAEHQTGERLTEIPLFIGMKVMLKKNIASIYGLCNGTTGYIHEILLDDKEEISPNAFTHRTKYLPTAIVVNFSNLCSTTNFPRK